MIRQAEFGTEENDVLSFGTYGKPIDAAAITEGHRQFVHEKLAEIENRIELHEIRERRTLEDIRLLLHKIEYLSERLQGS